MPRVNQHMDYFDPQGQKLELQIDIPETDWCDKVSITLGQQHLLQMKKLEDGWHVATSLDNVKNVPARVVKKNTKPLDK